MREREPDPILSLIYDFLIISQKRGIHLTLELETAVNRSREM